MLDADNVDWIARHFALLEGAIQQMLPRLDPQSDHRLRTLLRRDLRESARCAERVCAALALRHTARDQGDLGWYVAASFVLSGDWRAVADTLTWPEGIPDWGRFVALQFALSGETPTAREDVEGWIRYTVAQSQERQRVVDAMLEQRVFESEQGSLVWGEAKPGWDG